MPFQSLLPLSWSHSSRLKLQQQQIKAVYAHWCVPQMASKQQLLPGNAGQCSPSFLHHNSCLSKSRLVLEVLLCRNKRPALYLMRLCTFLAKRTKAFLNILSLVWCSIYLGAAHNLMLCSLHIVLRHLKEKESQHPNYFTSPQVLEGLYLNSSRFSLLDINAREVSN